MQTSRSADQWVARASAAGPDRKLFVNPKQPARTPIQAAACELLFGRPEFAALVVRLPMRASSGNTWRVGSRALFYHSPSRVIRCWGQIGHDTDIAIAMLLTLVV